MEELDGGELAGLHHLAVKSTGELFLGTIPGETPNASPDSASAKLLEWAAAHEDTTIVDGRASH